MKLFKKCFIAFDYMFFRIAKAYYRWDGKQGITAIFTISLFYCSLLFIPLITYTRAFYGKSFLIYNESFIKPFLIILPLIILIFNTLRYWGKFDQLNEKYKNENLKSKKLKGILIIVTLSLPWIVGFIGAFCL